MSGRAATWVWPATNLPQRLSGRLKEWTGRPWFMDIQGSGAGVETAWEREKREKAEVLARIEEDPFVVAVKAAFPGAEIAEIRKLAAPETPAPVEEAGTGEEAGEAED